MAGFDDLIPEAMPYMATEEIAATCGTSWLWEYSLADNPGNPVDLTSGFTGAAEICSPESTVSVVTVYVTFPSPGVVRCIVPASFSALVTPGIYYHEVTITRTSDSAKVVLVGAGDSTFRAERKAS